MSDARNTTTAKPSLVSKLRELGYVYRDQKKRVDLWSHPATLHRIAIPRRSRIDDDLVRSMLRQAGRPGDEIEKFIASAKT